MGIVTYQKIVAVFREYGYASVVGALIQAMARSGENSLTPIRDITRIDFCLS
jgi:hypothetical protein